MTELVVVKIGYGSRTIGTVGVSEDTQEWVVEGDTDHLFDLLDSYHTGILYRNLSRAELLGRLPELLENGYWARAIQSADSVASSRAGAPDTLSTVPSDSDGAGQ